MAALAKAANNFGTAFRKLPANQFNPNFTAAINAALNNTTTFRILVGESSGSLLPIFRQMDPTDLAVIGRSLDSTTKANVIKSFDDVGALAVRNNMFPDDFATAATRSADDLAGAGARNVNNLNVKMPDGTTKTVRAGSKEFWSTVRLGGAIGAGVGLLLWIEKKFEDADEEYKNCMSACLPHNWDEHEYGNVVAADLLYSTPASLEEYQITPIPSQPYCTAVMDDCGKFCEKKCDDLVKVDIPLGPDSPLNPFNPGSPLNPFNLLKKMFGNVFGDIDVGMIGGISSVGSCLIVLMVLVMTMSPKSGRR
jgi:hypothetical protein